MMHDQMISTMVVTAPAEAQTPRWQARTVGQYERSVPTRRAGLRTDLAARLLASTGRLLPLEKLYAERWLAVASVGGETFRLYRHGDLVRPCVYCGTDRFESPEITDPADLGYALSAWCPLHEDCETYDALETLADR